MLCDPNELEKLPSEPEAALKPKGPKAKSIFKAKLDKLFIQHAGSCLRRGATELLATLWAPWVSPNHSLLGLMET